MWARVHIWKKKCASAIQLQVATFVFAPFLLGEPLKGYRAMIIIFMLIGVSLITRPSWLGFPPDLINDGKTEFTFVSACSDRGSFANKTLSMSYGDRLNGKTENDAEWYYYLVAISVPILAALVSILTRKCSHVLPSVLMFWFAMGCLICSFFGGI